MGEGFVEARELFGGKEGALLGVLGGGMEGERAESKGDIAKGGGGEPAFEEGIGSDLKAIERGDHLVALVRWECIKGALCGAVDVDACDTAMVFAFEECAQKSGFGGGGFEALEELLEFFVGHLIEEQALVEEVGFGIGFGVVTDEDLLDVGLGGSGVAIEKKRGEFVEDVVAEVLPTTASDKAKRIFEDDAIGLDAIDLHFFEEDIVHQGGACGDKIERCGGSVGMRALLKATQERTHAGEAALGFGGFEGGSDEVAQGMKAGIKISFVDIGGDDDPAKFVGKDAVIVAYQRKAGLSARSQDLLEKLAKHRRWLRGEKGMDQGWLRTTNAPPPISSERKKGTDQANGRDFGVSRLGTTRSGSCS